MSLLTIRSDYKNARNFTVTRGSLGGSLEGTTHSTHRQIVWPCPDCGSFINNSGHRKCGNPACKGSRCHDQKRYLEIQVKTQRSIEEGLHTLYACMPCDQCKYSSTRPMVCSQCSILSEE